MPKVKESIRSAFTGDKDKASGVGKDIKTSLDKLGKHLSPYITAAAVIIVSPMAVEAIPRYSLSLLYLGSSCAIRYGAKPTVDMLLSAGNHLLENGIYKSTVNLCKKVKAAPLEPVKIVAHTIALVVTVSIVKSSFNALIYRDINQMKEVLNILASIAKESKQLLNAVITFLNAIIRMICQVTGSTTCANIAIPYIPV